MTDISDAVGAATTTASPDSGAPTEDALIEAVLNLWISEPGLSAKNVHAKLSSEQQFAEVSMSEIKKACSKATKRRGGSAASGGTAGTAAPADSLSDSAAKRIGKLGAMDVCSEFAGALWTKLTGDRSQLRKDGNLVGGVQLPANCLIDALLAHKPAAGKRNVVYLSLAAIQHAMVLELGTDGKGELCGRPFASWVFAAGGDELNEGSAALARDTRRVQKKAGARGYRAEDWVNDARRCKWMGEAELRAWCDRLTELRERTEGLLAAHLKHCAPKGLDQAGRRLWAKGINDRVEQDGLMIQPANCLDEEMVKDYTKMLKRSGMSKIHTVIHRVLGNQIQNVEQLLDFPLSDGAAIADLVCELFGEHPSAACYTRMLEFEGSPEAWEMAVREAKGVPGT